jgi:hypothetical protein
MKRLIFAALLAAGLLTSAACEPDLDRLRQAVRVAINWVVGSRPDQGIASCAVILFDQSVDPATNKAYFTPVYRPNNVYLWWQACVGIGTGTHSLPTYKASGYTQGGDFSKNAVCWATNPDPNGELKFPCAFDTRSDFNWVKYLSTSFNGVMVVGSLG